MERLVPTTEQPSLHNVTPVAEGEIEHFNWLPSLAHQMCICSASGTRQAKTYNLVVVNFVASFWPSRKKQ